MLINNKKKEIIFIYICFRAIFMPSPIKLYDKKNKICFNKCKRIKAYGNIKKSNSFT